MADQVRVDKWLWAVRIFKTRTSAGEACSSGRVRVAGEPAKSARRVSIGDEVSVRRKGLTSTWRVERIVEKRVGADIAVECYTDLTPEDQRPQPRSRQERIDAAWAERVRGSGRPTKRDRRQIDKFLGRGDR